MASNHEAQAVNRTLRKSRALLDSDVILSQPQGNLRCLSHLSISIITHIYVDVNIKVKVGVLGVCARMLLRQASAPQHKASGTGTSAALYF